MLEQTLKDQVSQLFGSLKNDYTFQLRVSATHPQAVEIEALLRDVVSCSHRLTLLLEPGEGLEFSVSRNAQPIPVIFKAIPTGHEFTTLLLLILNLDGVGKNLPDEAIQRRIESLSGPIEVKSYISLSCTNCPDVVQAINIISIFNNRVHHEIIDGAMHQQEVEALNVQAVPSVYLNGELLHVGRTSLGELLEKMEGVVGSVQPEVDTTARSYDVIVAGGGPAGVSAAIYSARKGFKVALVAEKVGGQVTETVGIENMISVSQTTGAQLSANLKAHLHEYPVDVLENRRVDSVELASGLKQVRTSMGEILEAPALIVATGASWRKLNVPGEQQYIGSGVAFCTHCDGPFYKGKKVAVIGGGNSGLEAAIDLSAIASEVTVLEYMDELKGDQVLQQKLHSLHNVSVRTGVQTLQVDGNGQKVTGIQFKNRTSELVEPLEVDGVFVQIGLNANSSAFSHLVQVNRMGEIEVDAHCRTSVPGVYAAGDVSVVPFKQIVIAMGEGAKAALSAFEDHIKGAQMAN